jgi:diacylglycerol kinase family enzyme
VEASPGSLEFTLDGELIGNQTAVFAVILQALRVVVVGPEYVPEP